MTLYEFNVLDFNDRMQTVNQYGTLLDNYITQDININCYVLDRFFVEVVYDADHNAITEVRSFKYGHSLDKHAPRLY